FYVYILYSAPFDKYYVGQTDDIERRLAEHNGLATTSYTSKYRPWLLQLTVACTSRKRAVQLERFIKSKKRKAFIIALIEDPEFRLRVIAPYTGEAG
ncbi:MAG: GIY-YIG nuclease family protein, partial [Bacteroidota bacterium]